MTNGTITEHVTCLGCGCGCDDLTVEVAEGLIVNVTPTCPIGRAWFGDGRVPTKVLVSGRPATLSDAVEETARLLRESVGRCLAYLGADISSQTQRAALALADVLRATVDTGTSASAADGLLAGQRRGRTTATLGEIRGRADIVVFWGVDPAERYPRFLARHGPKAGDARLDSPVERSQVVAVSIGDGGGMSGADLSVTIQPDQEIGALSLMRAFVLGQNVPAPSPNVGPAIELAGRLTRANYAVLVYDGEPASAHNPLRAEALIALTQALNTPTRAALSTLRAGGNRVGAEAVLTSQAGYPFAVDYSRGYPAYQPARRGLDRLTNGAYDSLLVVGTPPDGLSRAALTKKPISSIIIGPRASESSLKPEVAIDTGVAGIHESGIAYRMDEVPLELTPPLPPTLSAMDVVGAVLAAVSRKTPRAAQ